jgi:hypothetical protein
MNNFITVLAALEQLTTNSEKTISRVEYDMFLKEFVFDKLKGKSFGTAFCEKFGFSDIFLKALSDETAKSHIEKLGYIDDTRSN